jgi:hypothetical protein
MESTMILLAKWISRTRNKLIKSYMNLELNLKGDTMIQGIGVIMSRNTNIGRDTERNRRI